MAGHERATEAHFSGHFVTDQNQYIGSRFNTHSGNIQFIQQCKLHRRTGQVAKVFDLSQLLPPRTNRNHRYTFRSAVIATSWIEMLSAKPSRSAQAAQEWRWKSQVAIEACYRTHKRNPESWVFWVHASSASRFQDGYKEIAEHMRIPGRNDPNACILPTVCRWLSDPQNGTWFMVVDNADDEELMLGPSQLGGTPQERQPLKGYLPISDCGTILLTSRTRRVAEIIAEYDEHVLEIGPMSELEALTLVRKKLGQKIKVGDDASQLVRQLDYMPLAISQAAAYIKETTPFVTVASYVRKAQEDPEEQLRLLCLHMRDPRRDQKATNAVLLTWHVSFSYIYKSQRAAGILLALMSILNREHIPIDILEPSYAAIDQCKAARFEDSIAVLRSFDLIGFAEDEASFRMHRLVQLSTRHWLQIHELVDQGVHAVIQSLNQSFPQREPNGYFHQDEVPLCQRLLPHVEEILGLAAPAEYVGVHGNIFWEAGDFYAMIGRRDKAVETQLKTWQAYVQVKGKHDKCSLEQAARLGFRLRCAGKDLEAERILRDVCGQGEELSCHNEPWYWESTRRLGASLSALGKHDEAMHVLSSLLQVVKQAVGENHNDVLTIMEELALVYAQQGQHDQAIVQLQCVVNTSASIDGVRDVETMHRQYRLGSVLYEAGRLDEAESVLRKLVDMSREVWGNFETRVASSKAVLGAVLHQQGQLEKAILLYDEAVSIYEALQGPGFPDATPIRLRASRARQKLSRPDATSSSDQHVLEEDDTSAATPSVLNTVEEDGRKEQELGFQVSPTVGATRRTGRGVPSSSEDDHGGFRQRKSTLWFSKLRTRYLQHLQRTP
ncbi:hypothetical protein LTR70_001042 [Exophiala xenobiotica]|uniref:Uncharacterized protein n=1 Tax=Lithohypha guttulata TaxID=1690604 RepID=A0ABR0KMW8_9EURO|nr:hypothetical protein LTR24_000768 [Lithohypha guttulata]KAK5328888.1 hypothetical protein LTR70_001042 [Exophiala xenobiotica]